MPEPKHQRVARAAGRYLEGLQLAAAEDDCLDRVEALVPEEGACLLDHATLKLIRNALKQIVGQKAADRRLRRPVFRENIA